MILHLYLVIRRLEFWDIALNNPSDPGKQHRILELYGLKFAALGSLLEAFGSLGFGIFSLHLEAQGDLVGRLTL